MKVKQPFKGNTNDGIDGAAEGNIIQRIEQLGKDVSIDDVILVERPFKNCIKGEIIFM